MAPDWQTLPGGARVARGLDDLRRNNLSPDALLVLIAAPRLRALQIAVVAPTPPAADPEAALYAALQRLHGDGAHQHFNALRREIVSFADALQSVLAQGQ